MRWYSLPLFSLVAVMALQSQVARSQVGNLQIEPNQQSYEVRLVNQMGYPIRLKMVRYGEGRFLEVDLPTNASTTRQLYAGERVLCVWNHQRFLTLAAQVNVDSSGTLRIRPVEYPYAARAEAAAPGAPRTRAKESMEPLPRLKLEK